MTVSNNLAIVEAKSLQQARLVLQAHLDGELRAINSLLGWTDDRALTMPFRIVVGSQRFVKPEEAHQGTQVFLYFGGARSDRRDLIGYEDMRTTLRVEIVMPSNAARPVEEGSQRVSAYRNCVANLLADKTPRSCDSNIINAGNADWGIYNCHVENIDPPTTSLWEDMTLYTAGASISCFLRYRQRSRGAIVPDLPHVSSHMPLPSASNIVLEDSGGHQEDVQPNTLPLTLPSGSWSLVGHSTASGKVVKDGVILPSIPQAFTAGNYQLYLQDSEERQNVYSFIVEA